MSVVRVFAGDFGASGGKCFAGIFENGTFRLNEVHRFAHEAVPFYQADASGTVAERTYWDDVLLYQNLVKGLREYRRTISDNLDGIGIDTWGADGQFFTADGDAMGKMYAYRDHRLDDMAEKVRDKVGAKKGYAITGIHFHFFNVSNQLYWFMLNRKKALKPGAFYLPAPALFYYYLGGTKAVDSTFASVTQLMDAHTKTWSPELLRKLKIPASVMPEIVKPGSVIGQLHAELASAVGLNRARLIAVGGHDTASAFAAAPVDNAEESLIISSGTWSLIGKLIPEAITSKEAQTFGFSNEGGIGNVRLLKNCMGTWLVQELKRIWQNTDGHELKWVDLDRWTREAPSFRAFVNPDDKSFVNPPDMQKAIDDYCRKTSQPVPVDRGTYLRVVYESLALKYRMVNEQLTKVAGRPNKVVHIVGGGSKNIMLNQFSADAIGLPVLAGPEEATATGNCMVQAMGLGVIKTLRDGIPLIREAFPIREYKPQDTERWNDAYRKFKELTK
ncbi:MAG: FGGY-family carbohydrate kinase [bacterium]